MKDYLPLILIVTSVLLFIFSITLVVLNPKSKSPRAKKQRIKKVNVERVSPPLKDQSTPISAQTKGPKINYLAFITFIITSVILTIIFLSEDVSKWQLVCFIIGFVIIISSFNEGKNKENQVVRLSTLVIGLLLVDASLYPLVSVNPKILYYMIGLPLLLLFSHRLLTLYVIFSPLLILIKIVTCLLLVGLGIISFLLFSGPLFILIGVFFFLGALLFIGVSIFSFLAKVITF